MEKEYEILKIAGKNDKLIIIGKMEKEYKKI